MDVDYDLVDEIHSDLESLADNGLATNTIAPKINVGLDTYRKFFKQEILQDLVTRGGSTCRFIDGGYGSGKTHVTCLLEQDSSSLGLATIRLTLSKLISLEDSKSVTRHILANLSLDAGTHRVKGLPDILDAIKDKSEIDVSALEDAKLPHPGFQLAMVRRLKPQLFTNVGLASLNRFLRGERVTVKELKAGGVLGVKNPLGKPNAEHVLATVITGLSTLGVPGTALFFDENEQTFTYSRSKPPKRVRDAANQMRSFIDQCFNGDLRGMVAMFTVLPGFLERCTRSYPALSNRLSTDEFAETKSPRWPISRLDDINEIKNGVTFTNEVVPKFVALVEKCQGDTAGLIEELTDVGYEEAKKKAVGFKRDIAKALAFQCLNRMSF